MVEIIALIFLTRRIGRMAIRKGLKPLTWKAYTILSWLLCEITGIVIAICLFGQNDLFGIVSIALVCAFGGFLIVRAILERKPDYIENDIDKIGSDDLKPPVNQ